MGLAKQKEGILDQLREHATLGGLPDRELTILIETSDLLHFSPNEVMLQQGSASDCALFIISGEAEILAETAYGEIHVAHGPPQTLIGEIGAFTNLPRIATVRARTPVDALRIDRSTLLELGNTNPKLLLFVIGQLGERLSHLNRAIGLYTNTLSALERSDFDTRLLEELLHPMPELADFSHSFLRLAEQITTKRQHFEEMAHAAAIQRSMLPRPFKPDNRFMAIDLYGVLYPAREVGGDFFDYFAIDDRRIAVTIGDVSGKGVPASLFMAIAQSLIRLTVREGGDLAEAITRVNSVLASNNQESMFATAVCVIIDVCTGKVVYSNCGHNPPLIFHRGGSLEQLLPTGPPLGAAAQLALKATSHRLEAGDRFFLFSDGLPEAMNKSGEFFGQERLERIIHQNLNTSAKDLVQGIIAAVTEFEGGASRHDDIACVGLVYRGRL